MDSRTHERTGLGIVNCSIQVLLIVDHTEGVNEKNKKNKEVERNRKLKR